LGQARAGKKRFFWKIIRVIYPSMIKPNNRILLTIFMVLENTGVKGLLSGEIK
jgi:hypothetical protein